MKQATSSLWFNLPMQITTHPNLKETQMAEHALPNGYKLEKQPDGHLKLTAANGEQVGIFDPAALIALFMQLWPTLLPLIQWLLSLLIPKVPPSPPPVK